jgi:hypothetical protein
MDLISLLVTIVIFALIFWLATWIIRQTLPAEVQKVALVVVGVIALLVLLSMVTGYVPPLRYR